MEDLIIFFGTIIATSLGVYIGYRLVKRKLKKLPMKLEEELEEDIHIKNPNQKVKRGAKINDSKNEEEEEFIKGAIKGEYDREFESGEYFTGFIRDVRKGEQGVEKPSDSISGEGGSFGGEELPLSSSKDSKRRFRARGRRTR